MMLSGGSGEPMTASSSGAQTGKDDTSEWGSAQAQPHDDTSSGVVKSSLSGTAGGSTPPPSTLPVITLRAVARPCVQCGRPSYWVAEDELQTYGFRLCWEHLTPEERAMVQLIYMERGRQH